MLEVYNYVLIYDKAGSLHRRLTLSRMFEAAVDPMNLQLRNFLRK